MRVVLAPDKFRGSLSAAQAADAMAVAVERRGWDAVRVPMSDGGEGFLHVLGGPNRTTTVTGPLGDPVEAKWRFVRRRAVLEMAEAAGLEIAGGAEANDPLSADTTGVGELIGAALDAGARSITIGMGGSATTDGGLGALRALGPVPRLAGVRMEVACDVRFRFVEAASRFAGQKGASPAQVQLLSRRLDALVELYVETYGVDVSELVGSGAAGGLAGGLAVLGANLCEGFEVVADHLGLESLIEEADLVVTGEGLCDTASFDGKVVGGVAELSSSLETPVVAVVGELDPAVSLPEGLPVVSLLDEVGPEESFGHAAVSVTDATDAVLGRWLEGRELRDGAVGRIRRR